MTLTFRPLTADDLTWILPLEVQAQAMPWQAAHFTPCWEQNALQRGWGIWSEEGPCGYYVALWVADESHLLNLVVDPRFRRRGFATQMLHHWLGQNPLTTQFWLEVRADNLPAIALYEQNGFVRTATRQGYYRLPDGQRIDAWVMYRGG